VNARRIRTMILIEDKLILLGFQRSICGSNLDRGI
jgi:hypothetical protein